MNQQLRSSLAAAMLGAVTLAGASFAATAVAEPPKQYLATVVDTSAAFPHLASVPIRVVLDRVSSDDEIARLGAAFESGRNGAIERELTRHFVGRLEIDGRMGDPIGFARRYHDAEGDHLILVARRDVSQREMFSFRRANDYPWVIVDIVFDAQGAGGGRMITAARLSSGNRRDLEVHQLQLLPARLLGVRKM